MLNKKYYITYQKKDNTRIYYSVNMDVEQDPNTSANQLIRDMTKSIISYHQAMHGEEVEVFITGIFLL